MPYDINYKITFSPTSSQVNEIEKWLITENKRTGVGFYCNWEIIKSSFNKDHLAAISLNNKTIGFATWLLTSDKTARIEIMEVMPKHRKKGVGKKLTIELFNFFKNKGVSVVDLQCSPPTSEPIWKSLGFLEFSDDAKNYNIYSHSNKRLYLILTEHLQVGSIPHMDETIELWNSEPDMIPENTPSSYKWNLEFICGTRKLSKPIIHPAHYDWRIRWKINDKTISDNKIKRFTKNIIYGSFIIIEELSYS